MNHRPLRTSVVIPCYNAGSYLKDALDSVYRQTRQADEVIVVDDGSTDNSREIAKRHNLTFLTTGGNLGPAAARNLGWKHSRSDVVAWLDADDFWEDDHLETIIGLLEKYPDAALAYSSVRAFGYRSFTWSSFPCIDGPSNVVRECFRHTIVPHMTAATRIEALKSIGGFNESLRAAPDFDAWLRLSLDHLFICTNKITAHYRNHASQISRYPNRQAQFVYKSRIAFLDSLKSSPRAQLALTLSQDLVRIIAKDLTKYALRRNSEMRDFINSLLRDRTDIGQHWLLRILLKAQQIF